MIEYAVQAYSFLWRKLHHTFQQVHALIANCVSHCSAEPMSCIVQVIQTLFHLVEINA